MRNKETYMDTKMRAEEYVAKIHKLDVIIRNRLQDHSRWVKIAEGFGGASSGDRVQSSRNLHKSAEAIGNYVDIEREINALKQERQHIINTIERLPHVEYEVIYKLYVETYTLKEVAYHFGKSYDWVKRHKHNALELLQNILDGVTV